MVQCYIFSPKNILKCVGSAKTVLKNEKHHLCICTNEDVLLLRANGGTHGIF